MARINISVPDELYEELKGADFNRSQVAVEALRAMLDRRRSRESQPVLDACARRWLRLREEVKAAAREADDCLKALLLAGAKPGDTFKGEDGRLLVLVDRFATEITGFKAAAFCRYSLEHVT